MPHTPHVLLVEDEESIRSAVGNALRREGYEVRAEADGASIREVLAEFRPHLAILDVRLPTGPDGFAIAEELRARSDVPLLFLTAAEREEDRLAGFEAGADDYLVKPFSMAELLARARVLLRRSGSLSAPPRRVGDMVIDEVTMTAVRNGHPLCLTPTEYRLLSALVRHRGQVLSKSQLLALAWDSELYETNVVEVHMVALRRKIEAHGPRVIHTVHSLGYTLRFAS